jgi:hypothetical protein
MQYAVITDAVKPGSSKIISVEISVWANKLVDLDMYDHTFGAAARKRCILRRTKKSIQECFGGFLGF